MAKSKKNFVEKRSKYLIIAAVALIAVIGVSYAWFTQIINGTQTSVLTAGNLELAIENENAITLDTAIPMTEEQGKGTTPHTFTLHNKGDIDAAYTIYLDNDAVVEGENKIPNSLINYYLTKGSETVGPAELPSPAANTRVIDSGVITAGDSISYSLNLWIDETATTDIKGKKFAAKLRIEASQKGIPEGTNVDYSTGQTIPSGE